jgi:hypothetical protein
LNDIIDANWLKSARGRIQIRFEVLFAFKKLYPPLV